MVGREMISLFVRRLLSQIAGMIGSSCRNSFLHIARGKVPVEAWWPVIAGNKCLYNMAGTKYILCRHAIISFILTFRSVDGLVPL
jgi:hypothetical protein